MLPTPRKFFVTAACAEGSNKLNAFDNALLKAGIGNINLVRVSSIMPPQARFDPDLELPPGALVPTAYGSVISDLPGELIAAAVGVALSEDSFGVIMEFAGKCSREEAHDAVSRMLEEAFQTRGMDIAEKKIEACEHRVQLVGCCLAAVPMWY